jgi:uncharacterized protein YbaA (DUF1428 family)
MSYFEGFVAAVPTERREEYRRHGHEMLPLFREFGVRHMVDAWGDDVPTGKVTDFHGAVQATPGETVAISWLEYPSKAERDDAMRRMMEDARFRAAAGSMPFDGRRMIYGGFASLVDVGGGSGAGEIGYLDGYIVAVPEASRDAYRKVAEEAAGHFARLGAIRTVEAWGDEVPEGQVTDFRRAVKAEPHEAVVFSFVIWPSKAVRTEAWKRMSEENPMTGEPPFDGRRMIYGGFVPLVVA